MAAFRVISNPYRGTVVYLVREAKGRVEEGKVHHVLLRLAAADGRQVVPQGQQPRYRRFKLALMDGACVVMSFHVASRHASQASEGRSGAKDVR